MQHGIQMHLAAHLFQEISVLCSPAPRQTSIFCTLVHSVRSAAVEFVATAAAQLSPAEVYALLLPVVAPALTSSPASLADPQVGAFSSCALARCALSHLGPCHHPRC